MNYEAKEVFESLKDCLSTSKNYILDQPGLVTSELSEEALIASSVLKAAEAFDDQVSKIEAPSHSIPEKEFTEPEQKSQPQVAEGDKPKAESIPDSKDADKKESKTAPKASSKPQKPLKGIKEIHNKILTNEENINRNSRSVFIRNIDQKVTAAQLREHLEEQTEGLKDLTLRFYARTSRSKGQAYAEYESEESALKAIEKLDNSTFHFMKLSVEKKRLNLPKDKFKMKKRDFKHSNKFVPVPQHPMMPMPQFGMPMPQFGFGVPLPFPPMNQPNPQMWRSNPRYLQSRERRIKEQYKRLNEEIIPKQNRELKKRIEKPNKRNKGRQDINK
ncbi:unnamed protein product [Moneuplotes crassus]|uniref:RRM domain-containing protein n=1 Tax=Euplotes crassus TaxID=5936 RepID=A0AAD2D2C7_EUPCR|nr:unnamed protein product [Moneuplotes crassus]